MRRVRRTILLGTLFAFLLFFHLGIGEASAATYQCTWIGGSATSGPFCTINPSSSDCFPQPDECGKILEKDNCTGSFPCPTTATCPFLTTPYPDAPACSNSCTPPDTCVADSAGVVLRCCQPGTLPPGLPPIPSCVKIPLFGCLPLTPEAIAEQVLRIGMGLGALLAVIFLIVGGFGVITSAGNPEQLEKSKAQITAAVAGLVFLLASVLILDIIGGKIIGIPFFDLF